MLASCFRCVNQGTTGGLPKTDWARGNFRLVHPSACNWRSWVQRANSQGMYCNCKFPSSLRTLKFESMHSCTGTWRNALNCKLSKFRQHNRPISGATEVIQFVLRSKDFNCQRLHIFGFIITILFPEALKWETLFKMKIPSGSSTYPFWLQSTLLKVLSYLDTKNGGVEWSPILLTILVASMVDGEEMCVL